MSTMEDHEMVACGVEDLQVELTNDGDSLPWNMTLLRNFDEMRQNAVLCDIVIVSAEGNRSQAHSQVLAAASPFFQKIMITPKKSGMPIILKLQRSHLTIEKILQYMYTGKTQAMVHQLQDMIQACDTYGLAELQIACMDHLKKLTSGDLLEIFACQQCNLVFYNTTSLKRHQECHNEEVSVTINLSEESLLSSASNDIQINSKHTQIVNLDYLGLTDHLKQAVDQVKQTTQIDNLNLTKNQNFESNKEPDGQLSVDMESQINTDPFNTVVHLEENSMQAGNETVIQDSTESVVIPLSINNSSVTNHILASTTGASDIIPTEHLGSDLTEQIRQDQVTVESDSLTQHSVQMGTNEEKIEAQIKIQSCTDSIQSKEMITNPVVLDNLDQIKRSTPARKTWRDYRFKCSKCSQEFSSKQRLKGHEAVHEGKKLHCCNICGKQFIQREYLNEHMLTHSGEKNFVCEICDAAFINPRRLRRHMTIHSWKKRFMCTICDSWGSHRKESLEIHMRSHSGEKPFKCDKCPQKFHCKGNLQRHKRTVHRLSQPIADFNKEPLTSEVSTIKSECS